MAAGLIGLLDWVGYPVYESSFPPPHVGGSRIAGRYTLLTYLEILERRRRNRLRQDPTFRALERKYAKEKQSLMEEQQKGTEMRMYSVLLVEI